eukprot:1877809-Amphidinium_carterae.1
MHYRKLGSIGCRSTSEMKTKLTFGGKAYMSVEAEFMKDLAWKGIVLMESGHSSTAVKAFLNNKLREKIEVPTA